MGSGLSCFRSKAKREEGLGEKDVDFPVRPHDGAFSNGNASFDAERLGNTNRRSSTYPGPTSHVPNAVSRRTTDLDIRYQGEQRDDQWAASPTSTQVSDMTLVTTLTGLEKDTKLKEEDVDDPECKERARKAEEARIKAEKEEQERMDFLQWM